MRKCFIISPIGKENSETRKNADKVFKHIISPVCQKCGFEPVRVDQINQSDEITQTIIDMILSSDLVIADMSEHNPNVFFEIGYRACTGKPIIHIKSKNDTIPFDIANIRAFDYDLSDLDSVDEIRNRLEQTVNAFQFDKISATVENTANLSSDNANIITTLYNIQDQIEQLKNEIHNKDNETIQTIIKASQPATPAEDPNSAIMKIFVQELLKNPNSMKSLIQIGEMSKNISKE